MHRPQRLGFSRFSAAGDPLTRLEREVDSRQIKYLRCYPVLVSGWLEEGAREAHTVCIVGFRSPAVPDVSDGESVLADENIEIMYVHDDNLGPNARFRIEVTADAVSLVPASPEPRRGEWPSENPTKTYHAIVPTELVVAVHPELRTDPLELQRAAVRNTEWLPSALASCA